MKKAILVLLLMLSLAGAAFAQGSGAPTASAAGQPITPAEAQRALEVLQNPQKRNQLLETLQTIAKAAPATTAPASTTTTAAPAPAPKGPLTLAPGSLGAQLLALISRAMTSLAGDALFAVTAVTHFRSLWRALVQFVSDPDSLAMMADAAWRLVLIFGAALLAERLVQLLFRRMVAALDGPAKSETDDLPADGADISDRAAPAPPASHFLRARRLLGRLPLIVARLVLELIPVAAFGVVAVLLLGTPIGASDVIRLAILKLVNAYLVCRIVMCVLRMLVSPSSRPLRLLRVSDENAAYIEVSVRRITAVVVFGTALAEVALLLGLSKPGQDALVRLVGLAALLLLMVMVLQCRRGVARWIRAPQGAEGAFAMLRNRLGDIWQYLAIFLIVALWVVWAVEVRNGVTALLRFCAATLAVLIVARLIAIVVLALLDRLFHGESDFAKRFVEAEGRATRYFPLLRAVVSAVIGAITVVTLLQVWGIDAVSWFSGNQIGARLVSAAITIAIATAAAVIVWEATNAAIERHIARLDNEAQFVRSSRLKTLLPILRTSLLLVILAIVGLTALSEVGVNIAPLLAGAGIVGIAVGFGSQKLVQDVITGLFLLLENAMQVGDTVTVAGLSGSVESLSIRTLWLRAGDGSVYVVPFSAVSTVTNSSRGVGNASVSVNVGFEEDVDRVSQTLKEIAAEMRREPAFKAMMLSDLELWGVDKVDAATVTITGQIVCTVSGRWGVQREFNKRMKNKFQAIGIKLSRSIQTVVLEGETGTAAATPAAADALPARAVDPPAPPPRAIGKT